MVELSFSLEGAEVVSRRLGIVAAGVTDFREPLKWIGRDFLKTFDMNFSSRGAMFGGWAPRKPRMRGGVRIDTWPLMEKTGRMRRSFDLDLTRTQLVLNNKAPYFIYHQSRALPRTNLPRRMMMKIRNQDADMIVKHFQSYLVGLARFRGDR